MKRLMKSMNNPQLAYKTILVAGTNGKGSTSAMLANILSESGIKTGLYTSPHLFRLNERIKVRGKDITSREIASLIKRIRGYAKKASVEGLTFFEFMTAMAFLHFYDIGVEVAVIEVGLGGRFDATNIVEPELSIITNIGLDHSEYLGGTLSSVAIEKAGIIRRSRQVVTGADKRVALSVIRKRARELDARLLVLDKDFFIEASGKSKSFDFISPDNRIKGLRLNLRGAHQQRNAALALKAVELLRESALNIPVRAIRRALKGVEWPGRFDCINKKPVVIADSAHNGHGARALRETLYAEGYKDIVFVFGAMEDKDISAIIKELIPITKTFILTEPSSERSATVLELQGLKVLSGFKGDVLVKRRVGSACKEAMRLACPSGVVCATGSIFLLADVYGYFSKKSRKLL
jgi:dihydrofolate synthase/folylpolyglutamate synthase